MKCNHCMKGWEEELSQPEVVFEDEDWEEDEYGFISFSTFLKTLLDSRREGIRRMSRMIMEGKAPEPCCRCPYVK